jgi:hypothetical protein
MATTTVSFQNDIVVLFTSTDIDHMSPMSVYLNDYAWMSQPANAQSVYQQLESGQMPPSWGGGEGPWPASKVQLFNEWMEGGYQP